MAKQIIDCTHLWKNQVRQVVANQFNDMHNLLLVIQGAIDDIDPDRQRSFCNDITMQLSGHYHYAIDPTFRSLYQ